MMDSIETMPQTVPSLGSFTSGLYDCTFGFADFDLSLLPSSADCEVPYSPPRACAEGPHSLYGDAVSPGDFKGATVKQEPAGWSSPAYSGDFCPSPDVKREATLDLEEILRSPDLRGLCFPDPPEEPAAPSIVRGLLERRPRPEPETDHRLLREVLKDTSFQQKYNLKQFVIGGVGPAFKSEVKMENGDEAARPAAVCEAVEIAQEGLEPMLSLAMEQLREDLNRTCGVLGIATDPALWSADDVRSWLVFNLQQFAQPMTVVENFNMMTGVQLARLTEEQFQHMAPQVGGLLHAQLEIWKAACCAAPAPVPSPVAGAPSPLADGHAAMMDTATQSSSSCGDASEDEDDDEMSADGGSSAASPGGVSKTSGGRGGSHIHLWQFLKELLANQHANGACIRWLDRQAGVFKIEDSVRVARLWGKRKNRPAMNYDKLSRSIRQYYKKGIMKKTERSQRLVYQFCHPYCL